jgi:glycolate oxidase iron-sulfur subunit
MGREAHALDLARRNIDAWLNEIECNGPDGVGIDAILITASGCGTTVKDYGFMFRDDPAYADKAQRISSLARDITEYLDTLDMEPEAARKMTVAYHSACSMQHGQQIRDEPKRLLRKAGFDVKDVPEGHICCGSAGVYNILQPDIAERLRDRKVSNIARVRPQIIATGNIGCMTQIGSGTSTPVVHTIELLDWAYGGPPPPAIENMEFSVGTAR